MEKEFVNYNQALKLKELGFDEPCIMYIDDEGDLINDDTAEWIGAIKCPLKSQAFRWFREKYGNFLRYDWGEVPHFLMIQIEMTKGKTYEEAELACLTKLIEIVEQAERIEHGVYR